MNTQANHPVEEMKTFKMMTPQILWSLAHWCRSARQHQCEKRPPPRKGYNYYITCFLGNITVQKRYGHHS